MTAPRRSPRPAFLFVGGHTALDLVNTRPLSGGRPRELLATPEALAAWLERAGVGTPAERSAADEALVRQVRTLRERLRRGLVAIAAGEAPPPALVKAVNAALRADRGHRALRPDGTGWQLTFASGGPAAARILGQLAAAAADLLASCDPRRIRQCGSPDCVLFFYDTSKSGRRRWCRMATCGNRAKVAAFRRRHRDER